MTTNVEFIFTGTPYQLAVFALDFGTRQVENNPLIWQQNTYYPIPYMIFPITFGNDRDVNPISIGMVIDDPNPFSVGYLKAQLLNGRTLVTGAFDDEDWELYRERYETLYAELTRYGLIEIEGNATAPRAEPGQDAPIDDEKRQVRRDSRDDELCEIIERLYKEKHLTDAEIASRVWVGKDRVKQIRHGLGLKGKPRKKNST